MHKWRDLQFKVESERLNFWETFSWQIFIYSRNFCRKFAERKSPKKYFFNFVLMSGLGLETWLYTSKKPTHYLLDHGDYISGGFYSLKSTPNDCIFEKLFHGRILCILGIFAGNLLRQNRRRNTFCILFWCLAWGLKPGLTSNKPTHYLLDYGDFLYLVSTIVRTILCAAIYNLKCPTIVCLVLYSSYTSVRVSITIIFWIFCVCLLEPEYFLTLP